MIVSIENPESQIAFWGEMIPFFSPIVMASRLTIELPWWEIMLSMTSLVLGSLVMAWIAARIYRVGILMYGKNFNLKDMLKWIFNS
jgi:ABC-2 type transport system permease protein